MWCNPCWIVGVQAFIKTFEDLESAVGSSVRAADAVIEDVVKPVLDSLEGEHTSLPFSGC